MKGIVFNLLEEVIQKQHGEDAWDNLLASAQVDGAYTSMGNYQDEDLGKLVAAASEALQKPKGEMERWFGFHAFPLMAQRYPAFFHGHDGARSFVLTLNRIIHPEVRKAYSGADVPMFDFDTTNAEHLLMGYQSQRRLCTFAQGLIEGAGGFFNEEVLFEHLRCMNRGDEKCLFRIAFAPKAPDS